MTIHNFSVPVNGVVGSFHHMRIRVPGSAGVPPALGAGKMPAFPGQWPRGAPKEPTTVNGCCMRSPCSLLAVCRGVGGLLPSSVSLVACPLRPVNRETPPAAGQSCPATGATAAWTSLPWRAILKHFGLKTSRRNATEGSVATGAHTTPDTIPPQENRMLTQRMLPHGFPQTRHAPHAPPLPRRPRGAQRRVLVTVLLLLGVGSAAAIEPPQTLTVTKAGTGSGTVTVTVQLVKT